MVSYLRATFNTLSTLVGHLVHRPVLPVPSPDPPPIPIGPFDCPRPQPLAHPAMPLPPFVAICPVAQKYRALLGSLDWGHFPERSTDRPWPGSAQPHAPSS